jgi:hypothetical protein
VLLWPHGRSVQQRLSWSDCDSRGCWHGPGASPSPPMCASRCGPPSPRPSRLWLRRCGWDAVRLRRPKPPGWWPDCCC